MTGMTGCSTSPNKEAKMQSSFDTRSGGEKAVNRRGYLTADCQQELSVAKKMEDAMGAKSEALGCHERHTPYMWLYILTRIQSSRQASSDCFRSRSGCRSFSEASSPSLLPATSARAEALLKSPRCCNLARSRTMHGGPEVLVLLQEPLRQ